MPFCPNPECQHIERHGEAAEFSAGIRACSDCGASLVREPVKIRSPRKAGKSKIVASDVQRRLLVTFAFIGFYGILRHVGMPGLDFGAVERFSGEAGRPFRGPTILALGLIPYINASIFIELLALFIQPLKKWRENGYAGRRNLVQATLLTTVVFAAAHGYLLVHQMESFGRVVEDPGPGYRLFFTLTLMAGTFVTLWVCDMISKRGVGHGISILIFSLDAAGSLRDIISMARDLEGENPVRYFAPQVLFAVGVVALIVLVERSYRRIRVRFDGGEEATFPLKLTTAGIVPVWFASTAAFVPAVISGFWGIDAVPGLRWLLNNMGVGTSGYPVFQALSLLFFYYLFALLLYRSKGMAAYLKKRNARLIPEGTRSQHLYIKRMVFAMALLGSIYLMAIQLLPDLVDSLWGFLPRGALLIVMIAIGMDIVGEVLFRWRRGRLVQVAEFHEPWKAGLLQNLLQGKKIPCQLQGYYHRSLLYFFGPYIEMSVFVPAKKADAAKEVIDAYLRLK